MKYAVITGSSSGIGKALVEVLCKQSIQTFGIDINPSNTTQFICDVSDEKQVTNVVHKIKTVTEKIDYIFNSAGLLTIGNSIYAKDCTAKFLEAMFRLNTLSTFIICREFFPLLKNSKISNIINISSDQTFKPQIGFMAYAISKAGINMLTKCLAQEFVSHKILVNAFALGTVRTNILKCYCDEEASQKLFDIKGKSIPLGIMDAKSIANFLFLFARQNKYITGEIIKIDAGNSL